MHSARARLCVTRQHSPSGTCLTTIKTFRPISKLISMTPFVPPSCAQPDHRDSKFSKKALVSAQLAFLICCFEHFGLGSGFVIKSAGFTFVPTFFVTNRPDLETSCIHRFCMSTCFALPSPPRLTKYTVAEASRCRFSPHDIPSPLPHSGSRALLVLP